MGPAAYGLDFETYCALDINKVGLDRYVNHPTFRVLIASLYKEGGRGPSSTARYDFVQLGYEEEARMLFYDLKVESSMDLIAAHNSEFEWNVLRHLSRKFRLPHVSRERLIDSAVVGRIAGAESKLEAAAPQLLNTAKMVEGKSLIRVFSIPSKTQVEEDRLDFDPQVVVDNPLKWQQFKDYCDLDAQLGHSIVKNYYNVALGKEQVFSWVTQEMNETGWFVDQQSLDLMQQRYQDNLAAELKAFRAAFDPQEELNLNSHPQLVAWCKERGVKAKSFDENNTAKLRKAVEKKLDEPSRLTPEQVRNYAQVNALLRTKQILGGSSLTKLQKIKDMIGADGRLRGQYLHAGAGQTLRTSGRGVQMQNLKRLNRVIDMDNLADPNWGIDNGLLAENIRQLFTAEHPQGHIIVGDFASVESRGLAYQAGAEWKLNAFRQGKDLYKVQAALIFGIDYDDVLKPQRQTGKVGELSCGYGAGPLAVKEFAEKMGTLLTEAEAGKLVTDWRGANPEVVKYWALLDEMLLESIASQERAVNRVTPGGVQVTIRHISTPQSLRNQAPKAQSIAITMEVPGQSHPYMQRIFHGCYMKGRNVSYYKPTNTVSGKPWRESYISPKTGQRVFYSIYGGKLAGILTQSMCREMFMNSLVNARNAFTSIENVKLIGQFHDEIVLEWTPPEAFAPSARVLTLGAAEARLTRIMSEPGDLQGFPLNADVHSAFRYIK